MLTAAPGFDQCQHEESPGQKPTRGSDEFRIGSHGIGMAERGDKKIRFQIRTVRCAGSTEDCISPCCLNGFNDG